jgi:predicted nucleic acid-binding protein
VTEIIVIAWQTTVQTNFFCGLFPIRSAQHVQSVNFFNDKLKELHYVLAFHLLVD